MESVISEHIEITPGICGGKPRIAGHRIRVLDIVIWPEQMGLSPDAIVSQHPGIALANVFAALAYYHDHLEETRQQIEQDEAFAKALQVQLSSKVREKLTTEDADDDSLPPG